MTASYRYVAEAAIALQSFISANIVTQLRSTESAYGLTSGYLPDPIAVLDYPAPHDDRSPLVQVYEDGMSPENVDGGQRNGIWTVPCSVVWSYKGDADLSKTQMIRRGWFDALMQIIVAAPQLGSTVVHTVFKTAALIHFEGDNSTTRYLFAQSWEVVVES